MKLIIDIPDNQYNQICELRLHNRTIFDDAIRNGIPLDKITDEIEALPVPYDNYDEAYVGYDVAKGDILDLIDKYTKGESL